MDLHEHEGGAEMMQSQYVKRDSVSNYFPLPNAIFRLGLHQTEIVIYAYLMSIEDRRTYQCITSYSTIADRVGIAVNTVSKYVALLEEHGLIRTEHTEVFTKDGQKRNGCLRYTILPIRHAIDLYNERQLEEAARVSAQQRALVKAERLGVAFTPSDEERSA